MNATQQRLFNLTIWDDEDLELNGLTPEQAEEEGKQLVLLLDRDEMLEYRAAVQEYAADQRREAQATADYWNENVRKPGEPKVDLSKI